MSGDGRPDSGATGLTRDASPGAVLAGCVRPTVPMVVGAGGLQAVTAARAAVTRRPYFARRSSLRIDSSASMTSSRETRLLAKLNFRLNALVGGRKAKT